MKSDNNTPENTSIKSAKSSTKFKKIIDSLFDTPSLNSLLIDSFFEEYPNRDMTKETYEENIQRREALIRKSNFRPLYFATFLICSLLFLLVSYIYYHEACLVYRSNLAEVPSYFTFYLKLKQDILCIMLLVDVCIGALALSIFTSLRQETLGNLEAHIYAYERFVLRHNVEEDMYESSIQMSYKYLDQYYRETREQATRGFRITVGVCVIGAAIVIIGVILMVFKITTAAYVTTASGVIIEFISSIFFHLYNKTIQSMGNYHNKLILSQNVAIALKITDSIEGTEKNTVKVDMIKALTADINQHINSNKPVD